MNENNNNTDSTDDIEVVFDGSCKGNDEEKEEDRQMGYGFVVEKGGDVVYEESNTPSREVKNTNNSAEYISLIKALEYVKREYPDATVTVYGDSELIINQVDGDWDTNKSHLIPLRDEARQLMNEDISLIQLDRGDYNERADGLARMASGAK